MTIERNYDRLFVFLCKMGDLTTAKYVSKYISKNPLTQKSVFQDAFSISCNMGHIHIAHWISRLPIKFNLSIYMKAFHHACEYGMLDVAKWLFNTNPKIDISVFKEYAFYISCMNDHLEISKWLLSIKPSINICIYSNYIFDELCAYGKLETVKWLLSIKPNIELKYAFCKACENGHLNTAKWLLHLKPSMENLITAQKLFISACKNGHIEIVKWLFSIKHDINNDFAFRLACENGHLEIAKWFSLINPNQYSYEIVNNNIISIIYNRIHMLPNVLKLKQIEICSICSDRNIDIQLNCNHTYCNRCISKWYSSKKSCPYCRTVIVNANFVKMDE